METIRKWQPSKRWAVMYSSNGSAVLVLFPSVRSWRLWPLPLRRLDR